MATGTETETETGTVEATEIAAETEMGIGQGKGNNQANPEPANRVAAPDTLGTTTPASANMRIRHKNGFEETLDGGRYEMKDNRGRTIVNRPATRKDVARLNQLAGT